MDLAYQGYRRPMSYQVVVRVAALLASALAMFGAQAFAQSQNPYAAPDAGGYGYQGQPSSPSPYSPPPSQGYGSQGYGSSGGSAGYGSSAGAGGYGGQSYSGAQPSFGSQSYSSQGSGSYAAPANDAYVPPRASSAYGYGNGGGTTYSPPPGATYSDPGTPVTGGSYGTPYSAGPAPDDQGYRPQGPHQEQSSYNQEEIITAGHSFFGAVSKNLASAVEYVFQSQGRPNGYILGEDAGGAFVVGLRYGEGRLYTKDAGDYKVFWQGPSIGYDAGGEGSKAMVLVYNLRDPGEIYNRFGGVQGAAYVIGGVSVQFQKYNDVTLAIIRSGVGLRLGANIGYLHYTRSPTWNPL